MHSNPLRRRLWINIGLICSLLLLVIVILLWRSQPQPAGIRPFAEINPAEIDRIEIRYKEGAEYSLQRIKERWRITRPIDVPANEYLVSRFLGLLNAEAAADYSIDDLTLTEFALDPPLLRLHLNQYAIDFGDTDPLKQLRYVLFKNRLYLFNDDYYPILSGRLSSLADNRLLPEEKNPSAFFLPTISVQRDENAGWRQQPPNPQLSADDLQGWVDLWRYARALYLEQRTPAAAEIQQRIKVEFDNGESITYSVIAEPDRGILYRSDIGLMFHMPEQTFLSLISPPQSVLPENTPPQNSD